MKAKIKNMGLKVIQITFGSAHFAAQTSADLIALTEATLVHKHCGTTIDFVMNHRRAQTKLHQMQIKDRFIKIQPGSKSVTSETI